MVFLDIIEEHLPNYYRNGEVARLDCWYRFVDDELDEDGDMLESITMLSEKEKITEVIEIVENLSMRTMEHMQRTKREHTRNMKLLLQSLPNDKALEELGNYLNCIEDWFEPYDALINIEDWWEYDLASKVYAVDLQ